ncbi:MAG: GBS Bsp-like repeat-containing protein, partial [Christensenellaceae bacterium]
MKVKKLVAFFVAIILIFGCFGTVYAGDFKVANAEIQNQNGDEKQGTEEQGVPNEEPSGTPKPSASAEPSETPKPSASAEPSETPKPSASATPSVTPKPSASATPSAMPKPTATSAVNGGQSNPFATVPVCDGIDVTKFNADGSQFHTGALNVRDMSGVSKVEFAIWSDASGGADVKWYNGNNYNNGCWGTVVDIANHGNHIGNYQIHVYGTDNSGNRVIIGHAIYKVEG